MKKICIIFLLCIWWWGGMSIFPTYAEKTKSAKETSCPKLNDTFDPIDWLKGCKPANAAGTGDVETGDVEKGKLVIGGNVLKDRVNWWISVIATICALWAVWALVYAGMLMQFSGGDEEKINKGKEVIKVTLTGTVLITVSGWIVYLVITMIFAIAEKT